MVGFIIGIFVLRLCFLISLLAATFVDEIVLGCLQLPEHVKRAVFSGRAGRQNIPFGSGDEKDYESVANQPGGESETVQRPGAGPLVSHEQHPLHGEICPQVLCSHKYAVSSSVQY